MGALRLFGNQLLTQASVLFRLHLQFGLQMAVFISQFSIPAIPAAASGRPDRRRSGATAYAGHRKRHDGCIYLPPCGSAQPRSRRPVPRVPVTPATAPTHRYRTWRATRKGMAHKAVRTFWQSEMFMRLVCSWFPGLSFNNINRITPSTP